MSHWCWWRHSKPTAKPNGFYGNTRITTWTFTPFSKWHIHWFTRILCCPFPKPNGRPTLKMNGGLQLGLSNTLLWFLWTTIWSIVVKVCTWARGCLRCLCAIRTCGAVYWQGKRVRFREYRLLVCFLLREWRCCDILCAMWRTDTSSFQTWTIWEPLWIWKYYTIWWFKEKHLQWRWVLLFFCSIFDATVSATTFNSRLCSVLVRTTQVGCLFTMMVIQTFWSVRWYVDFRYNNQSVQLHSNT